TSMVMVKYSCKMVWLMSSTLTFFSLSRAHTAAMIPTWSLPMTVTIALMMIPPVYSLWQGSRPAGLSQIVQCQLERAAQLVHEPVHFLHFHGLQSGQRLAGGPLELGVARLQLLLALKPGGQLVRRFHIPAHLRVRFPN